MQTKDDITKIYYYINLVIKKRWLIIIPFCLMMIAGIYLSITLPKEYEASTLILVEPQRVPSNYVKSLVTMDIESRVSTIKQQILSRSNLEKIIKKFGLYSKPEHAEMFIEDKLYSLRRRIEVRVTRVRGGSDAFSISFRGREPETIMNVANTLASYFMEENLKIREAQAAGTSSFLEEELAAVRQRLEDVEALLRAYRSRYMGELPEQLDTNLKILDTLQMRLNERKERLREERNRLLILESEIEQERKLWTAGMKPAEGQSREVMSLEQLKAQLAVLQSSYTDQHPDIIRLKSRIAKLEAKYGTGGSESSDSFSKEFDETQNRGAPSKSILDKQSQHAETEMEINNLESEIAKINQQIIDYQQRVERTPKREEELMSLRRDYDNIQNQYNSLLNRKLEAEIAVNMEKKQKGEQFRIIDYAKLPQKPISPNLNRLFLMAVAAGLGIGFGLVFLLDFVDTSIKRQEEVESELGIKVLALVPQIIQPSDKLWRTINLSLTILFVMIAGILCAGFATLAFKGVEPTLEIVQKFANL